MVRLAVRILRTPAETSAPGGVTANAVHVMRLATEEIEEVRTEDGKSAAAVAFGRKAGLARARTLNRESRLTIARKDPRVDGRDRSRRVCSGSRSRFARRASAYVRHDTKVQRPHGEDEAPSRAIALGVVHRRVDQHAGVYAVRTRSVEFATRSPPSPIRTLRHVASMGHGREWAFSSHHGWHAIIIRRRAQRAVIGRPRLRSD